jgi:hypothetical protein
VLPSADVLTTSDWISRIAAGGDVDECLEGARAAVRFPDDWNTIAVACEQHDRLHEARRAAEAAVDLAGGDHWPCRRAAELVARFGDGAAARRVLGRIEDALMAAEPAPAYRWVLLAQAYRDVAADAEAVRRCCARASAGAASPKDLADLAAGYVELADDREGARALLERAEAVARAAGEIRPLWDVAIRWKETLGDPARARTVLETATAEAVDVGTLTSLAIAWRSLCDDDDAMRSALIRGEAIAAQVPDWLALAGAYRDGGSSDRIEPWDPVAVRRCLDAAVTASPGPTEIERSQLAAGFRRWLADPARAAALEPPPPVPDDAATPARRVAGWTADPHVLLDRLRVRISADAVRTIAAADYGADSHKHHQALLEIQTTGRFASPLDWHPREVLELTRWTEGASTDHVARGFACAVLAIDAALPATRQAGSIDAVLAPLVESAWALGLVDELERLLAWIAEVASGEPDTGWAMLALALSCARRDRDDPRLPALVAALAQDEWARTELAAALRSGMRPHLWAALAALALDPAPPRPSHLDQLAALVGGVGFP